MSRWAHFPNAQAVVAAMTEDEKLEVLSKFSGAVITMPSGDCFWYAGIENDNSVGISEKRKNETSWDWQVLTKNQAIELLANRVTPPLVVEEPKTAAEYFIRPRRARDRK